MISDSQAFLLALSDDRQVLTISTPGGAPVVLDAGGIEEVLRLLGNARSQMLPAVRGVPDATLVNVPVLTAVQELDNLKDAKPQPPPEAGAALMVRSELFGWQMLPLSPADCVTLGAWLVGQRHIAAPPGARLN